MGFQLGSLDSAWPFPCRGRSCAEIGVFWLLGPQFPRGNLLSSSRGLIDEYCISAFQSALQASSLGPALCRAFSMSRAELRTNRGFLVNVVPTIPSREPPEQLTRTMLIDEYCNSAFQGTLQASSLEPPLCRAFSMSRVELRKNQGFLVVVSTILSRVGVLFVLVCSASSRFENSNECLV